MAKANFGGDCDRYGERISLLLETAFCHEVANRHSSPLVPPFLNKSLENEKQGFYEKMIL
ncbi:hypothetical protein CCY99_01450 [Helicobacter sp. 16-1353]|nr:hypothetical protein CCY99_01450 [Helicobacter sp. 16-1353]